MNIKEKDAAINVMAKVVILLSHAILAMGKE